MDERLQYLSLENSRHLRGYLEEARTSLKSVAQAANNAVHAIESYGSYTSVEATARQLVEECTRLLQVSGKIEALRHFSGSLDNVARSAGDPLNYVTGRNRHSA